METPGLLSREGGNSAQDFLCVTGKMGGKLKKIHQVRNLERKKGVSQITAAVQAALLRRN